MDNLCYGFKILACCDDEFRNSQTENDDRSKENCFGNTEANSVTMFDGDTESATDSDFDGMFEDDSDAEVSNN